MKIPEWVGPAALLFAAILLALKSILIRGLQAYTEELEALLRLQAAVGTENDMTEEPTIVRASYPLGDGMQVVEYRGGTPLRVRFALDYGSTPWRDWDPDRDPDLREQRPPPKEL